MPALAVKGAVIVVTVVAATCVAIYESPEVRQFAEDCRRKIAIALHSLGDEINPRPRSNSEEPRFNRPEDAEGFMQSSAAPGVEADEDSKRRQREELMYWNRIRLQKLEEEKAKSQVQNSSRGPTFNDFLEKDTSAENGAYVYNTGTDIQEQSEGLLQRGAGVRGLNRGVAYANPFSDENGIETTDASLISPEPSEVSEDIYGLEAGYRPSRQSSKTPGHQESLIDIAEDSTIQNTDANERSSPPQESSAAPENVEYPIPDAEGQSAWASIHAWADSTSGHGHDASFYSPLPVTPQTVASEPELLSGQATPTDSESLAGSGEDVGENASSVSGGGRYYDVISEDGEVIHTPGSWTEVGSVVSENDLEHPSHA